ncbi:DUF2867 domain-containing protein [Actinokineospora auranticolor]|uniref:Uncharacterized protein YbjT (DUF2867 family) n=1 Tax=Actinokineospora auranticolor TaxID=155976 RepID=A0A2S6H0D9_9PSEU|nr:DUF2867 domain-containing protein [Actinokineospora auranticolor]PPK70877.1 uncharacterized protein YbjT (DUF2867 family) [Actinokineospora auranticolor]
MARCLVLGAGGYVGTRLVAALASAGLAVVASSRTIDAEAVPVGVRVVRSDALDLGPAELEGVDVVYHLVHSLSSPDFAVLDERIARAVAEAAGAAGVRQLVYLGGPRPRDGEPSDHLASRARVGDVFLACPVPALVLQASMIIGAGSASFELLARAARGGPVIPNPAFLRNRSRPIALDDVIRHLLAATGEPVNGCYDIGGPEVLTYWDLIQRCARAAGLPRRVPLPAAFPTSLAAAATPDTLTRALLESLQHDLVPSAVLPLDGRTSVDRALRQALDIPTPPLPPADGALTDHQTLQVHADPAALWHAITTRGGSALPALWALRGAFDHVAGGPGLHRNRPPHPRAGDIVDSWTVVHRDDDTRELHLHADMRLPGRAWLTLRAEPGAAPGESVLRQTTTFAPDGLLGHLYWRAQKPAHVLVFTLMAHSLARTAETARRGSGRSG